MAGYQVIAAAIQVEVGRRVLLLRAGAILPGSVSDEDVSRLETKGLIAPLAEPVSAEGGADETPVDPPDAPKEGEQPGKDLPDPKAKPKK